MQPKMAKTISVILVVIPNDKNLVVKSTGCAAAVIVKDKARDLEGKERNPTIGSTGLRNIDQNGVRVFKNVTCTCVQRLPTDRVSLVVTRQALYGLPPAFAMEFGSLRTEIFDTIGASFRKTVSGNFSAFECCRRGASCSPSGGRRFYFLIGRFRFVEWSIVHSCFALLRLPLG
ncbi:hypothetical protein FOZ63_033649 [Perkinsus olseni]|uniref:Uncharacterized protein n=1 Tax=Perkinsus olseni TaxID=32597 RepID=A0A7J6PQS4_PEROL|nr:hypothetical protein FOZ63_033649 [Perkinsus olseni]